MRRGPWLLQQPAAAASEASVVNRRRAATPVRDASFAADAWLVF